MKEKNAKNFGPMLFGLIFSFVASVAWAQNNSSQAAAAAKKHQAEKSKAEKSETGKAAEAPATEKNKKPVAGGKASGLEACKKDAGMNPFKRENCVWTHCKDRWGKGGCPAAASSAPARP